MHVFWTRCVPHVMDNSGSVGKWSTTVNRDLFLTACIPFVCPGLDTSTGVTRTCPNKNKRSHEIWTVSEIWFDENNEANRSVNSTSFLFISTPLFCGRSTCTQNFYSILILHYREVEEGKILFVNNIEGNELTNVLNKKFISITKFTISVTLFLLIRNLNREKRILMPIFPYSYWFIAPHSNNFLPSNYISQILKYSGVNFHNVNLLLTNLSTVMTELCTDPDTYEERWVEQAPARNN